MYSVSDKYLEAFRKPYRTDRITGRIKLKDGTNIVLSDEILVQNKFTITRKVCGTAFDVGTFFAGDIALSIRSDDAKELDFGSAVLAANYEIVTGGTKDEPIWEEVPLGVFYIDGQRTTRRGQTLNLRGYDSTAKFDVDLPLLTAVTTLWDALVQACLKANVGLAVSEAWFKSLPNASVVPDFTSKQIQSCRDLVMWIAQTVGCYAYIDRNGFLQIKRYYYAGDGTFDRAILATERTKIEYTDTRTYLAYLTSYSENTPKLYQDIKQWGGSDIIKEGGLSLPNNPLLKALSAEQQDEVNMALMENSSYPTRYIKSQGFIDPAVDPLDVLAFTGGTIDIGQIISVCTEIKWKFRGQGHIICNNLEQYSDDAELVDAAVTGDETAIEQTDAVPTFSPVKSQTEKRIDALEAGGTGDTTIENAVVLALADIRHLIYSYDVVKFTPELIVACTGPDTSIVVGGYVAKSDDTFVNEPTYGSVNWSLTHSTTLGAGSVSYSAKLVSAQRVKNSDGSYKIIYKTAVDINGVDQRGPLETTGDSGLSYGLCLEYGTIRAPGERSGLPSDAPDFPNGCVAISGRLCNETTYKGEPVIESLAIFSSIVGFSSMAEYEAAVGLTRQSQPLDKVIQTVTVVPNEESTIPADELLQLAYAYTDNAVANHETSVELAHEGIYSSINTLNQSLNANAANIAINTAQIADINDVNNGILVSANRYTDETADQLREEFGGETT